ncbi:MAG: hypothetical protein JRD93_00685 [Deltaproteobacteria bacterium]|nr:hypothetical protein [Deltaproteobacteria bacterium]
MDLLKFDHIRLYLEAAQALKAGGGQQVEGTRLVPTGQNACYQLVEREFRQEWEGMDFDPLPPFRIRVGQEHFYKFVINRKELHSAKIEGEFNRWGTDVSQNWEMMPGADATYQIWMDLTESEVEFLYRMVDGKRTLIDNRRKTISVLPGVGVCQVFNPNVAQKEYYTFFPGGKPDDKHRKSAIELKKYRVAACPGWLLPDFKSIQVQQGRPVQLGFSVSRSELPDQNKMEVLVLKSEDGETRDIKIPVEFVWNRDPVYSELKENTINVDQALSWGESFKLVIPLSVNGVGTLKVKCIGNGISHEEEIKNIKVNQIHQISLRVDTSGMRPIQAENLSVLILTDSRVANRRCHRLKVKMHLVRLIRYPRKMTLDWRRVSFGSRDTETLEFFQSDTMQPVSNIEVDIPEALRGIVVAQGAFPAPNAARLTFESKSLPPGKTISAAITIRAKANNGLVIKDVIPVHACSVESRCDSVFHSRKWCWSRTSTCLTIRLKNAGSEPLSIFSIRWENNKFSRAHTLWQMGKSDLQRLSPDKTVLLSYTPNVRAMWFLPRWISDRIHIKMNCSRTPDLSYEARVWMAPRVLSVFRILYKYKLKGLSV